MTPTPPPPAPVAHPQPAPPHQPAYTAVAVAVVVVALLGGLYVVRGAAQWSSRGCNLPSSVVNAVVRGEPGTFEYCAGRQSELATDASPESPPIACPDGSPPITGALCSSDLTTAYTDDYGGVPDEDVQTETTTTTSYEQSPEGIAEAERQAACDAAWAAYDRDWAAWSAEYDTWSTEAWAANDAAWTEWDGTGPSPVLPDEDAWRSEHPEPTQPTC